MKALGYPGRHIVTSSCDIAWCSGAEVCYVLVTQQQLLTHQSLACHVILVHTSMPHPASIGHALARGPQQLTGNGTAAAGGKQARAHVTTAAQASAIRARLSRLGTAWPPGLRQPPGATDQQHTAKIHCESPCLEILSPATQDVLLELAGNAGPGLCQGGGGWLPGRPWWRREAKIAACAICGCSDAHGGSSGRLGVHSHYRPFGRRDGAILFHRLQSVHFKLPKWKNCGAQQLHLVPSKAGCRARGHSRPLPSPLFYSRTTLPAAPCADYCAPAAPFLPCMQIPPCGCRDPDANCLAAILETFASFLPPGVDPGQPWEVVCELTTFNPNVSRRPWLQPGGANRGG